MAVRMLVPVLAGTARTTAVRRYPRSVLGGGDRRALPACTCQRRFASASTESSTIDPAITESERLINEGTMLSERGDFEGAKSLYRQSLAIRPSGVGFYNLGVCQYQLRDSGGAISSFRESLKHYSSADTHQNLATALITGEHKDLVKALEHLREASKLAPGDGEIRFNLGVVLEASDYLKEALQEYTRAKELGVSRAEQNIRNVGGKIIAQSVRQQAKSQQSVLATPREKGEP
ncbi:uncharacterized protein L969DRAFT_19155 [Mixia osmundae IAM 14324]|uniref:Uncharacterized protein n=1 Tax=Mixia osmundae (strain CBS 9802 / IAM 14324 / JCM 22182 / KY 12970) TaxID=764103 RepID=G7E4P5_MIXOS|nr:uncharacterized protein L969DRAFT_19155 [Mixia osmundae IAM 14324]KEI37677.1 hypothetical protein L969DRAFT_19155 [Mixia osmundae IAM 14324]GAA97805.1 hypothetical protein E5Q_04484 [Mixia osmundae IAM 14324]